MAPLPSPSPFPPQGSPGGTGLSVPPPLPAFQPGQVSAATGQGLVAPTTTLPSTPAVPPVAAPPATSLAVAPPMQQVAPVMSPAGVAQTQAAGRRSRPRRRSRATWPSCGLCVVSLGLIGYGCYAFLASIDPLGVVTMGAPLVDPVAVTLFTLGVVLSVVAFVLAIAATVRSRPRLIPGLVLAASLVLPLPVAALALTTGVDALRDNAVGDVVALRDTVLAATGDVSALSSGDVGALVDMDPAQARRARDLITTLDRFGVSVPHKDEILRGLDEIESRGPS